MLNKRFVYKWAAFAWMWSRSLKWNRNAVWPNASGRFCGFVFLCRPSNVLENSFHFNGGMTKNAHTWWKSTQFCIDSPLLPLFPLFFFIGILRVTSTLAALKWDSPKTVWRFRPLAYYFSFFPFCSYLLIKCLSFSSFCSFQLRIKTHKVYCSRLVLSSLALSHLRPSFISFLHLRCIYWFLCLYFPPFLFFHHSIPLRCHLCFVAAFLHSR